MSTCGGPQGTLSGIAVPLWRYRTRSGRSQSSLRGVAVDLWLSRHDTRAENVESLLEGLIPSLRAVAVESVHSSVPPWCCRHVRSKRAALCKTARAVDSPVWRNSPCQGGSHRLFLFQFFFVFMFFYFVCWIVSGHALSFSSELLCSWHSQSAALSLTSELLRNTSAVRASWSPAVQCYQHGIGRRGSRCFCARDDLAIIRTSCWLSGFGALSSSHCFEIAIVALSELACASTLGPASLQSASRDLQARKTPGGRKVDADVKFCPLYREWFCL